MYPEDPPEVDAISLGILIADVLIIMLCFLRNVKVKLMAVSAFVVCVPTEITLDDGK